MLLRHLLFEATQGHCSIFGLCALQRSYWQYMEGNAPRYTSFTMSRTRDDVLCPRLMAFPHRPPNRPQKIRVQGRALLYEPDLRCLFSLEPSSSLQQVSTNPSKRSDEGLLGFVTLVHTIITLEACHPLFDSSYLSQGAPTSSPSLSSTLSYPLLP